MIAGLIAVIGLLVTRLQQTDFSKTTLMPQLPAQLALPEGAEARAVTFGEGWIGVVSSTDQFLIFTPDGTLIDQVTINLPTSPAIDGAATPSQP